MGLAETVKTLRERVGWTQTDLASRAGCSLSTIQKLEAGEHVARRSTVRLVAEALGLTLDALETKAGADLVSIDLPRGVYDSIAERAAAEGHESVPAFLAKVATTKTKRITTRSAGAGGAKAGTHA